MPPIHRHRRRQQPIVAVTATTGPTSRGSGPGSALHQPRCISSARGATDVIRRPSTVQNVPFDGHHLRGSFVRAVVRRAGNLDLKFVEVNIAHSAMEDGHDNYDRHSQSRCSGSHPRSRADQ